MEEAVAPPEDTPDVPVPPEPEPVRDTVAEQSEVAMADSQAAPRDSSAGAPGQAAPGTGPGTGGGSGGGEGGGTGTGTGPGSGPGSGGQLGLAQPPRWRQTILPPENRPRDLRGKTITITFWIKADGRVERVEFDPEIRDRDYANKFRERLLAFVFVPARSASGAAVAARYPMEFTFY